MNNMEKDTPKIDVLYAYNYLYLEVDPHLNKNVLNINVVFQILTRHEQCTGNLEKLMMFSERKYIFSTVPELFSILLFLRLNLLVFFHFIIYKMRKKKT